MSATIVQELNRLEQLYAAGFQDTFLNNALRKVIQRQIARDEADLAQIAESLTGFEKQFRLTSDDFWKKFQSGQMTDTPDTMEWNVLCKMRQRILARLDILRGVGEVD